MFLEDRGYLSYVDNLKKLKDIKIDTITYYIAKFILNEYNNNSELFHFINNIITGFMIARVIYIQPELDYKSKFYNVDAYLDTGLLLSILGFKTKEENCNAQNLIKLLKSSGVKLKCFSQNHGEVLNILNAYLNNINSPEKRHGQTLEYFDETNATSTEIGFAIERLGISLKRHDIEVANPPFYSDKVTGEIEEKIINILNQKII